MFRNGDHKLRETISSWSEPRNWVIGRLLLRYKFQIIPLIIIAEGNGKLYYHELQDFQENHSIRESSSSPRPPAHEVRNAILYANQLGPSKSSRSDDRVDQEEESSLSELKTPQSEEEWRVNV